MMIDPAIALFVYAALIAAAVWYINTHRERKPLYKRRHRRR